MAACFLDTPCGIMNRAGNYLVHWQASKIRDMHVEVGGYWLHPPIGRFDQSPVADSRGRTLMIGCVGEGLWQQFR
ncbi:hypothetical protein H2204_012990 [Knufia peltigerae]|uniref:Uncharacterized protein n=1 Tax=Knufia peltigerae TaxID=1002370 RepID=A0AA38XS69_9EURO|nr:hypothetical protein H2204_012990 [Knufia peltigerae]